MQKDWWSIAFKIGVVDLGMSPNDFWQLSLPEFQLLTQKTATSLQEYVPSRSHFEKLIKDFPDTIQS